MKIDQLIAKYLLNKNSKEELDQLEIWKKETEENLNVLRQMESIWQESDMLLGYQDFNAEAAYNKWQSKSNSSPQIQRTKLSLVRNVVIGIAASFLLLFMINIFNGDKDSTSINYSASTIVKNVQLNDGSVVKLSPESNITYKQIDNDQFIDIEGKAFFDIAKQKEGKFIINTDKGVVQVIGTQFVVQNRDKSIIVQVKEGIVSYTYTRQIYKLYQGDELTHDQNGISVNKINELNVASWASEKLEFINQPAAAVFKDLQSHFNQKFVFKNANPETYDCLISATFVNPNIDNILKELGLTIGLKYHKVQNTYVIDDVQC